MRRSPRTLRHLLAWLVLGVGVTSPARGQFGLPAPAIPPTPGSSAGLAPAGAAPAAPRTLWSSLGLSSASLHACRDKLCALPLGQMMNSMLMPMGAFTGGVIPTFCPPVPNPGALADQAAMTGGPGGPAGAQAAAAAIQADVAGAGARIAAIEYLSTVDCHYWPEAEAALIGRLRGDRVECVRFAAAQALGSGCCCTKKSIEALRIVVAGEDKDGFPSETSERVRATAVAALDRCVCRFEKTEIGPEPSEAPEPGTPKPPEPPGADAPGPFAPRAATPGQAALGYYRSIDARTPRQVKEAARRTLTLAASNGVGRRSMTTGNRSVLGAIAHASAPRPGADAPSPVLNLEHESELAPEPGLATSPPVRSRRPGRPATEDAATIPAAANGGDAARPQRSVFGLVRRAFRSREASDRDDSDRSWR